MSAVVPTAIANAYFLPRYLLPGAISKTTVTARMGMETKPAEQAEG